MGVVLLMLYCVVPSLMGARTAYPIVSRKKMKRIAPALRVIGIGEWRREREERERERESSRCLNLLSPFPAQSHTHSHTEGGGG